MYVNWCLHLLCWCYAKWKWIVLKCLEVFVILTLHCMNSSYNGAFLFHVYIVSGKQAHSVSSYVASHKGYFTVVYFILLNTSNTETYCTKSLVILLYWGSLSSLTFHNQFWIVGKNWEVDHNPWLKTSHSNWSRFLSTCLQAS